MKTKAFNKALKSFDRTAKFRGSRLSVAIYGVVFAKEIEILEGKQGFVRRRIYGQPSPGMVSEGTVESGDIGIVSYPTRTTLRDLDENVNGLGEDTVRRNAACAPEALKTILEEAEAEGNETVRVGGLILKKTATDYTGKSSSAVARHFRMERGEGGRQVPDRSHGESEVASDQAAGARYNNVSTSDLMKHIKAEAIVTDIFKSPTLGTMLGMKVTHGVFLKDLPVQMFQNGLLSGYTTVTVMRRYKDDVRVAIMDQDFGVVLESPMVAFFKKGDILRQV